LYYDVTDILGKEVDLTRVSVKRRDMPVLRVGDGYSKLMPGDGCPECQALCIGLKLVSTTVVGTFSKGQRVLTDVVKRLGLRNRAASTL